MRSAILSVLCFSLLIFALVPAAFAAKRVAFVVGIDAYDNLPAQLQLKKAVGDAHAVGAALKALGYEVIEADNVARLDFVRQWQTFLNRIDPGDESAFFFAGHGVEISGLNYLLPRDVPKVASGEEEVLKAGGLSLGDALDQVRQRKPQVSLYIVDACRDNPFVDGKGRGLGGTRGLARVEPPSGTFVMFSAGAGETALDRLSDDDSDPNSVYTRTLLPSLQTPGKSITEIARDVRRGVRDLANKVNHVQTPAYYDEVVGDFCPAGCEAKVAKLEPPHAPPAPPLTTPAVPQAKAIKGDFAGAPKQLARLELALVADDPAKASGPPLHDFVHVDTTYGIEQDVTLPGDIESFAATTDERSVPAIKLVLTASALDRINRAADLVDRRIALVLDGRTVLAVATLRDPLSTELLLTGDFSLNDVRRLADAISANPSGIH